MRTSLLYVKEVLPEVYIDGAAEADKGGGKIGPVATGEVVGAEGKEAIDGPELLDGNPVAAVSLSGFKSAPDMENSTIFFLRCTLVQGS